MDDRTPEYPICFANRLNNFSDFKYLKEVLIESQYDPRKINTAIDILVGRGFNRDVLKAKLLYPSGRPRSDMREIANVRIAYKLHPIIQSSWDNVLVNDVYKPGTYNDIISIPVVRYGKGKKGYYFKGDVETFCGTFYYYEPGSDFYLTSTKTLIAPNKISAFIMLGGNGGKDVTRNIIKNSASSAYRPLLYKMLDPSFDPEVYDKSLYEVEDMFDQGLCHYAREKGYDAVILTHMTGTNRLVSEVLDTRNRDDSFNFLETIKSTECPEPVLNIPGPVEPVNISKLYVIEDDFVPTVDSWLRTIGYNESIKGKYVGTNTLSELFFINNKAIDKVPSISNRNNKHFTLDIYDVSHIPLWRNLLLSNSNIINNEIKSSVEIKLTPATVPSWFIIELIKSSLNRDIPPIYMSDEKNIDNSIIWKYITQYKMKKNMNSYWENKN